MFKLITDTLTTWLTRCLGLQRGGAKERLDSPPPAPDDASDLAVHGPWLPHGKKRKRITRLLSRNSSSSSNGLVVEVPPPADGGGAPLPPVRVSSLRGLQEAICAAHASFVPAEEEAHAASGSNGGGPRKTKKERREDKKAERKELKKAKKRNKALNNGN
ncbi:hypothetical protein UCDDS831_g08429 [Diplodia seriata]|uniref:Uncharacterized protein n=1 Tax=Diplodia seriata TaxID=420778 RepID=A0A0G2DU80_9PEZI|nr:hypothetical protein UCDDS831_g08429 [Diplodia seriata]